MPKKLDGEVWCHQCGNSYEAIGNHWSSAGSCKHPEIDPLTEDILVGSLMGDGTVVKSNTSTYPRFEVGWSSEDQCRWLDDILGWLSTGVRLRNTAEEQAENTEDAGLNGDSYEADPENFSDQYHVTSRNHPYFEELHSWYDSGEKVWPEGLGLSPTVFLLWYLGDGTFVNRRIKISMKNEAGNENKISDYLEANDLPEPHYSAVGAATWSVEHTKVLFEYMAQSPLLEEELPWGFEYKFPGEYDGTGANMSDLSVTVEEFQRGKEEEERGGSVFAF